MAIMKELYNLDQIIAVECLGKTIMNERLTLKERVAFKTA